MVAPAYLVGTGGAIGAVCRYLLGQWVSHEQYPIATLLVNVLGSVLLGTVTFAGVSNEAVLFVGVGACGSFTTYSSFSFQTVRLWETGDRRRAVVYAIGTLGLCSIGAGAGALLSSIVAG